MNPAKATSVGGKSPSAASPLKPIYIGLLGRGTVGRAFAEQIDSKARAIAGETGYQPVISGVLRRSEGDLDQIIQDSDIVVELMGGHDPTRGYVEKALRAGRSVVTANKQLVASFGEGLSAIAREQTAARDRQVQFRYEAAIAGAIPIVPVLRDHLRVIDIDRVVGIVNGTTNFILEEMAKADLTFEDALARAQELGYAEPDPSEDINGRDAAAKMAILSRLAFGSSVSLDQVDHEGIENIDPDDLVYAKEFGLALKLLGSAEKQGDSLSVRVFPCFVSDQDPLANIPGPLNAVTIDASAIDHITLSGVGAGATATASIVWSDVARAVARDPQTDFALAAKNLKVVNSGQHSCFYIHMIVADQPGVLGSVADCLGEHNISIASAVQRGLGDEARLNLVTHECDEEAFWEALLDISKLQVTRSDPRAIRVREQA